jgi:hypothetical protein
MKHKPKPELPSYCKHATPAGYLCPECEAEKVRQQWPLKKIMDRADHEAQRWPEWCRPPLKVVMSEEHAECFAKMDGRTPPPSTPATQPLPKLYILFGRHLKCHKIPQRCWGPVIYHYWKGSRCDGERIGWLDFPQLRQDIASGHINKLAGFGKKLVAMMQQWQDAANVEVGEFP